jgi:hypothetical protein
MILIHNSTGCCPNRDLVTVSPGGQGMLLFLIVRMPCEIDAVTAERISLGSRSEKQKNSVAYFASLPAL